MAEQLSLFGGSPRGGRDLREGRSNGSSVGAGVPPRWVVEPLPAQSPAAPGLRCVVLGSGSSGNALLLETREGRVLVDAGFSLRELERRLRGVGVSPSTLRAVVLTHEHGDHCRGVVRLARRFRIAVYATRGTFAGHALRTLERTVEITPGAAFELCGLLCEPVLVPHDARQPVALVVEDRSGQRLGLLADCGSRSDAVLERFADLDTLVIETNHDLDMLRTGPYPWALKRRIAGARGHLSNTEAAGGVERVLSDRLRRVVLYHLSRTNNVPALAEDAIGERLERAGSLAEVMLTEQGRASSWFEVAAHRP